MYQCSYCPQTSTRKWNIQVHETRKHLSTNKLDTNHMDDEHPPTMRSEEQPTDWDLHCYSDQFLLQELRIIYLIY